MFEPVTFILGVASSVLTKVLTDLITGQIKSARKTEIQKEISDQLIKHFQEKDKADIERLKNEVQELSCLKRKIMDEVEILAGRDPSLLLNPDEIKLKAPISKFLFNKENFVKQELSRRLSELEQVIAKRREEFSLEEHAATENTEIVKMQMEDSVEIERGKDTIVWKKVDSNRHPVSKWEKEIIAMEDRIRRRRAGEEIDEQ